jgi:L-threonylcarbamoyladenylate synthase
MNGAVLARALDVLGDGRVVAVATETFFGFLADVRRPDAIERVFSLKGRNAAKGVALLLPSREAWNGLVTEIPPLADHLARTFWPGPLTIVLPAQSSIDPRLQVDGAVGARFPGPSDASHLTTAFGAPLTATSANLATQTAAKTAAEVEDVFAPAIRRGELFVVPGVAPGGAPSTLVRVASGRLTILRQGQIRESELAGVVPPGALG